MINQLVWVVKFRYCGFWPSGHFSKSRFVRLMVPRFVHLDLFCSKSPIEGARELKTKAKFAIDTDQHHEIRNTIKLVKLEVFVNTFCYFEILNSSKRTKKIYLVLSA
jgi:hypothetical protein